MNQKKVTLLSMTDFKIPRQVQFAANVLYNLAQCKQQATNSSLRSSLSLLTNLDHNPRVFPTHHHTQLLSKQEFFFNFRFIFDILLFAPPPPRKYPYFDVVMGLVRSHDPNSYAGGSICDW
jgi:hypothetical protein